MERLKSRKLWVTVLTGAVVAFAGEFGVEIDPENLYALVGLIAAYVGGQAIVDKSKVQAEVDKQVASLNATVQNLYAVLAGMQEINEDSAE